MSSDIRARIEKLLELAKRGGTAAESALAAEKAAELIARYGVELTADYSTFECESDEHWKAVIATGIGRLYAVKPLRNMGTGRLEFVGREVSCKLAVEMMKYLVAAVKRENRTFTAGRGLDRSGRQEARKAFRVGAARVLCHRLTDKATTMQNAGVEGAGALVVADYYKSEQSRIEAWMNERGDRVKPGKNVTMHTDPRVTLAGAAAAKQIGLEEQVCREEAKQLTAS